MSATLKQIVLFSLGNISSPMRMLRNAFGNSGQIFWDKFGIKGARVKIKNPIHPEFFFFFLIFLIFLFFLNLSLEYGNQKSIKSNSYSFWEKSKEKLSLTTLIRPFRLPLINIERFCWGGGG